MKCSHCGDDVAEKVVKYHWTGGSDNNGYGHRGLCCDCMDLSCGMSLAAVNDERQNQGKATINKPWPGRDANGRRLRNLDRA